MTRDTDSSPVSRRYLLQTLGTAGAAGLAGCGGGGNGGSGAGGGSSPTGTSGVSGQDDEVPSGDGSDAETTEVDSVEHVDLGHWPREYLLSSGEDYEITLFDSWSPQQVKEETGTIPLEVSYLENPYHQLNFSPEEVPETFLQLWNDGDYWASAKVDQLLGSTSGEDVKQSLEENDYEQINEIGNFGVYSKDASETVHAVSSDRHAIAANITQDRTEDASQSQLEDYLEDVLRQKADGHAEEPEEIAELREALGPKDTFGAANQIGGNNFLYEDKFVYNSELGDGYQPTHGATSVDVEEGQKYRAWLFEEEDIAEEVKTTLLNDDKQHYNDWEEISVDGRIMQAEGQIDLGSQIENSKHIENQGLLVSPQI